MKHRITEESFFTEQAKQRVKERNEEKDRIEIEYKTALAQADEIHKQKTLDWILFLLPKCKRLGAFRGNEVLRYGTYLWDAYTPCVAVHLTKEGIFFQNSIDIKLTPLEEINLNFANLISLAEYIQALINTQ